MTALYWIGYSLSLMEITILFFSQQFEGGVDQESFVTLETLYLCFCSIINSFKKSTSLEMSQRDCTGSFKEETCEFNSC